MTNSSTLNKVESVDINDNKTNNLKKVKPSDKITRFYFTHFLRDTFLIVLAITSAGFGLKGFLIPNSFIDGGVTGISLLTEQVTGISLSLLLVIINFPFLLLGYSQSIFH